jgi:hypothetical protein
MNIGEQPEGNGKLTSRSGSVADLDYKDLSAAYAIAGRKITISDMAAQTLGGRVTGGGTITTGEQSMAFDIHAKASDVNLTDLFDALPGDVQRSLNGRANLDISVSGSGSEWNNIKQTLSGDGLAELINGEIIDWNIAKSFFDEIDQFAGANIVTQQIKAKYPKVFTGPNTSFEDLKSDFVIKDGAILARNLQLKHNDYAINGKGSLNFGGGLNVQATFVASKALTSDLIAQYNAVKYLADAQGRIEVPLELTGTLPRISAKPDSEYLRSIMSKALTEQGLDLLKKKNLQDLLPFGKKSESKPDSTKKK